MKCTVTNKTVRACKLNKENSGVCHKGVEDAKQD